MKRPVNEEAVERGRRAIDELYDAQAGSADQVDLSRAAIEAAEPALRAQFREELLGEEALQAGADAICLASDKPAGAADRNEVRIEIEAALDTLGEQQ